MKFNYWCIDCQMHEEAQGVDQPAQYKMVTAQQVKGHLRPKRDVLNSSRYVLYCTLKHKINLSSTWISIEKKHTYRNSWAEEKRSVQRGGRNGSGSLQVTVLWHPAARKKWLRRLLKGQKCGKKTNKCLNAVTTFLRRFVLLWTRLSTSCRQWTGLSSLHGDKSVLAVLAGEGSFFPAMGFESSCAARASTWLTR